jgi:5-methyltetrahydropteroyltriglutamate--homocysteine methyltransferase
MEETMMDLPRADHVGSLLRPDALKKAHRAHIEKRIDDAALEKGVSESIVNAVRHEEDADLRFVTDGEFRRGSWFLGFVESLSGIELKKAELMFRLGGHETTWFGPVVTGKLTRKRPIVLNDYCFLAGVTKRTPKVTMPTPSILHFFGGKEGMDPKSYRDRDEFAADLCKVYREEIDELYRAGCRVVQLDEVALALLCDETIRASLKASGEDPKKLSDFYFDMIAMALRDKPKDLTVLVHLCRGNYKGHWMGQGGYDPIAEQLFALPGVSGYLLEYDSERAGSFAPLKFLPKGKRGYLGVVSSKIGTLESLDDLRRRLDDAFKHAPEERLGVSPQCGFASSVGGNPITEAEQWAKLARVTELARAVWGTN